MVAREPLWLVRRREGLRWHVWENGSTLCRVVLQDREGVDVGWQAALVEVVFPGELPMVWGRLCGTCRVMLERRGLEGRDVAQRGET